MYLNCSLYPGRARIWRAGVDAARSAEMGDLLDILLDMAGPLTFVASQLLHAASPFFGSGAIRLARLLEAEQAVSNPSDDLATGEAGDHRSPRAASD